MTLRELAQRYGKPIIIALVCIFALVMVRKSLPDVAKLHPTNYGMLALGTVLFAVTYLIQAFGWHLLLRALGQPVSVVDSARMFFMSMIARWMPGRVLYAATRLYIGRQIGISVTAVAFAIVLELIYILLGGVIVIVAFAGGILHGFVSSPKGILTLIVAVGVIVVAGMLAIKPSTLISLSRVPLFRRLMKKMAGEELSEENQPRMSTSSSLLLIVYAAGYWLVCGLMFGVLSSGFMPMNPDRWLACIPAFAGSWLIGFFSILTPAGIGVREYAMTVMLEHSMGQAHAVLMSVASRVVMMFVELLLAGLAYLFLRGDMTSMPFSAAKREQNQWTPASSTNGARRPAGIDVTMRMAVNPGLRAQPSAPPTTPLTSARTAEAIATARLAAFSSPPPVYAPPSHNGNGIHASRSMSRSRLAGARRWTLVKRRPCFCGREQRQNDRIPRSRYKPWRPTRVLTEDL